MTDPTGSSANADSRMLAMEWHGDRVVLTLSGDLDYDTAPDVRRELLAVVAQRPVGVVLDLRGVKFLNSAGLAVLVETVQAGESATAVRMVASGSLAARPIELTGLGEYFGLRSTTQQALDEL